MEPRRRRRTRGSAWFDVGNLVRRAHTDTRRHAPAPPAASASVQHELRRLLRLQVPHRHLQVVARTPAGDRRPGRVARGGRRARPVPRDRRRRQGLPGLDRDVLVRAVRLAVLRRPVLLVTELIVSTCCAEPRSMWQASEPVFVIDIAIFGSSVGPYTVLSSTAASVIWSAEQVDPDPDAAAEADADAAGAAAAEAAEPAPPAEDEDETKTKPTPMPTPSPRAPTPRTTRSPGRPRSGRPRRR